MMIPKDINTMVFDCDGVMFQTQELNKKYYNTLLSAFDLPPMTEDQFEYVKMQTGDLSIKHLFEGKVDLELVNRERKNHPYIEFVPYMEMSDGFMPLLKTLKNKNFKCGVATNRHDTMGRVMSTFELNDYFEIVVTAADVKNAKPHPEQLLKIKDFFDIKTENMVYVGDSLLDQQAASAAGVLFIAFANKDLDADIHVNSMKEIENLIP